MIGLIAALEIELCTLRNQLTDERTVSVGTITFHLGKLHGVPVVLAQSGVGKIFAAICAQTMLLEFQPKRIIHVGVAGALNPNLDIGDLVIADNLVQYDFDTTALGYPLAWIKACERTYFPCDEFGSAVFERAARKAGLSAVQGTIATGDRFIADQASRTMLVETFHAVACEMEGAAVGIVCYLHGVPVNVLRTISDRADEGAAVDFPTFAAESAQHIARIIEFAFSEQLL